MKYVVFLDIATAPATAVETISETTVDRIESTSRGQRTGADHDTLTSWYAKTDGRRGDDRYAEVVEAETEAAAIALAIAQEMADRT